jgi:hypothetical protein
MAYDELLKKGLIKPFNAELAYSDAIRHLIPIDSATRFRRKAPPDSDRFRHPGLELGDAG